MLEQLTKCINDSRDDLVALTQDLVRFPTINPPGDAYRPCVEYIAKRLQRSGFQCEFFTAVDYPGHTDKYPRINVIGRREGKRPGKTIHFNSHIDVVPAGHGWTFDPFGAAIHDGKIFGRGTCDMKGGLATSIIAAEAYIRCFPDYAGVIEISGTVDEESGGFGGVAYLAEKGMFSKPRVDHVIIPEPLNKDRICLGHRGVWWAEIETHGHVAHGSMPFLGDCAVRHMGAVMESFEKELFPALAAKQTQMPVVPEGARKSTMNINGIRGGQTDGFTGLPSPNVPDSCKMTIDRRYLLEENVEDVRSEVVNILDQLKVSRPKFDYSLRELWSVEPTMTDRDAPVVQAVADAIRAEFGKEPDFVISPGTYDQKHIARIGHLHDCIAYGPGVLDLAHQPDEWIGIDDMVQSAKVMANAIHILLSDAALS
jgi:succinyl-diaminopimelate desuccinylase